ncbi:AAA family ATPase [Halobacteriovorax sp. HLS]|uniref:AAA family ATPase n=1 Tax=Halobacteriovorax sp. HLS TaxID=2234000 RepID=UPI000FD9703E|nr:AAA family ATPase [Halobacteriovorax sp. HLS]
MRLQSIEIENITSLSGKHFIDFEDILKEGELFAITGPTGSGKSSILSSISLALYGKNYKKSLDSRDFVTLGKSSASVHLNFQTKGQSYRASWSLKVLKKNGDAIKKPSPSRVLTQDGVAIDKSADEVVGLTFEQFIRSVVLNQGQFSKFITSNFSERRKILERLYSENEISELNKKLRENVTGLRQEIEILQVKLEQSLPYSEDEIHEAKDKLPDTTNQKKKIEAHYDNFSNISQHLKDFTELSLKRLEFRKKDQENKEKLTIANDERNHALKNQSLFTTKLESYKEEYEQQKEILKKAMLLSSKNEHLKESIQKISSQIELQTNKLEQLNEKIDLQNTQNSDLQRLREQTGLNNKLKHLGTSELTELTQLNSDYISINTNNDIHRKNLEAYDNDLEKLTLEGKSEALNLQNLITSRDELTFELIEKNYDENSYKLIRDKIHNIEDIMKEKNNLISQLSVYKDQIKELDQRNSEIKKMKTRENLSKFLDEFNLLEQKIEDTTNIYELEKNDSLLAELIDQSISQKQCQLCLKDIEVKNLQDIKEKIINRSKNKITKEDIEKLNSKRTQLSSKVQGLKIQSLNESNEVDANNTKIIVLRENLNLEEELNIELENLAQNRKVLQKGLEKFQEISKEIDLKEQLIKNLRETFKSKKDQHEKLLKLVQENREQISQKKASIEQLCNFALCENESALLKQMIIQAKEHLELDRQIKHNLDLISQIQKQAVELELSIKDGNTGLVVQKNESNELVIQIEQITNGEDLSRLTSELEKQREAMNEELKQITKLSAEKETNYTRLLTVRESITDQFKAIENSLMSLMGQLQKVFKVASNYDSLNHETNIFISKSLQLKTYLDDFQSIEAIKRANETLIQQEKEQLKNKLNELAQQLAVYTEKIKLYEQKSSEQEHFKLELKAKLENQMRFTNLVDVLGKNKDEFRNFVLGFIEKQLILATNSELNSICEGRYKLTQKESTHGHEFFIIDSWNGALERKVSTLSGGETFLVSLAMALSLAEMTRGQVDIDCFFIDEGFGSLDKDSIEDAFNALMAVRSRGKQIGIISHIKELTDRIAANIRLNKSNDGQSKIDIIFN